MTITRQFDDVVFFATDATYLPTAWVAARQAASEPGRQFDVVLLVEKGLAAGRLAPPDGCQMLEIALPAEVAGWPSADHMSRFAYARLAAPDCWLQGYRRALYLDSDIAIMGPLAPLLALEMGDAIVAMAEDCGHYLRGDDEQAAWRGYSAGLGQDPQARYFNSGVILFDLRRWQAQRCWPRAVDYVTRHRDALRFMDQDALNCVTAGQVREISPRWNFQTHYFGLAQEGVIAPRIVHYLDILKPWRDPEWRQLYDAGHGLRFARLFAQSPWPDYVHPALYRASSLLWPGWRLARVAMAGAAGRKVSAGAITHHVRRFRAMAAPLDARIRRGFAESLSRGCYGDLAPAEADRWRRALQS